VIGMLSEKELHNKEMSEIKEKLATMHHDIKLLMENHNQQYLDLIRANSKKDFINALKEYMGHDIEHGLERGMVKKCDMKNECRERFTEFLQNNACLIHEDNVTEKTINQNQSNLDELKSTAPYKKCEICFLEVNDLFKKQINLMRALRIYSTNEEKRQDIALICEESIVKEVLEPLSNKQRLQIIKSMANGTRTFSSLSELTGLRGGNLLFHIQKLLDCGIIIQRHERGDYMLTEKGYSLLVALSEINCLLDEENSLKTE